ncbi:ORF_34 [Adoxophyes orana granulovirus]|uniref:ADOR34 n=1 Tax=Adoxophyes orana granulovirus TaxID=170617 RepID=Q7T9Y1_GVAO|nr:ORF_34 [Adoxophyes orana granulovirus]AAP85671.1 ORF_34 [Adoxophyes orana granulovirus]AJA91674.1 ADOR34 [Adoxophyes orana granulovirus]
MTTIKFAYVRTEFMQKHFKHKIYVNTEIDVNNNKNFTLTRYCNSLMKQYDYADAVCEVDCVIKYSEHDRRWQKIIIFLQYNIPCNIDLDQVIKREINRVVNHTNNQIFIEN